MNTNSQKLPAELLHQIIHTTVVNSIHSIGTSCGTQWDVCIFTTLANVSPVFGSIVRSVVGSVFSLADGDSTRDIINSAEKLMHEFHQLGEPDEWPEIAGNYPEQRSTLESSVPTFLATQAAAKTALRQVNLWPIATPEIVTLLDSRTCRERDLVVEGTVLVRSCIQLEELLDQAAMDRNNKAPIGDETHEPLSASPQTEQVVKYAELYRLLRIIETSATKFDHSNTSLEIPRFGAVQLPGVGQALRKILSISCDRQSPLGSTTRDLLSRWMNCNCSFLAGFDFGYPISLSFIY